MKEDKENLILCTDKSGRLAAQKREFYVEAMQSHLAHDPKLSWQDQCSNEKRMTAHTLQWGRLLKLGAKWDNGGKHWDRVKNALRTKFCMAPPMSGYYKDHKEPAVGKEYLGPKLRPVCGAVESRIVSHAVGDSHNPRRQDGQGDWSIVLEHGGDVWSVGDVQSEGWRIQKTSHLFHGC